MPVALPGCVPALVCGGALLFAACAATPAPTQVVSPCGDKTTAASKTPTRTHVPLRRLALPGCDLSISSFDVSGDLVYRSAPITTADELRTKLPCSAAAPDINVDFSRERVEPIPVGGWVQRALYKTDTCLVLTTSGSSRAPTRILLLVVERNAPPLAVVHVPRRHGRPKRSQPSGR